VTASGVEHVRGVPWDVQGVVIIEGSSLSMAAASSGGRPCVRIGVDLSTHPGYVDGDDLRPASLDGLPLLDDATDWPLELE
jgi:hypothetical protein